MQRRTFIMRLAMLAFVLAATALSLGGRAIAQPITACGGGYRVDLTPLGIASCYPIPIKTSWGGGAVIWPAGPYTLPGIYTEFPPVPPGTPLDFVSVWGISLPPFPGQTTISSPCGPLCVRICTNAAACLVIKVFPGPCPVATLPCP